MPLALTFYTFVVGLHVVFAVSFLGAAGAFSILGPMMRDNPQHARFGLAVMQKVYKVAIFPGIVLVFASGLYQTIDGEWSDDAWLNVSIVLFLLMAALSVFVIYPAIKTAISELEKKGDAPGPPSATFVGAVTRLRTFGPLMGVSLMVITFLMVTRPF
ncbi:MAG: DUF2269 family protein [Solirubrobacterales bacterium]